MEAVLMTLFRCVRDLAIAVRCVVPTSADRLLDQMGIAQDLRDFAALDNNEWLAKLVASGFKIEKPEGVFPRLDMPESEPA
jgi:methionyl-tRNA synthetase